MLRWRRCLFVFSRLLDGVGLVACRIEQAPAFVKQESVPLLPEHRFAPSLNSAAGFGFGGVLAVLEPFTFFLSSSSLLVLGFQCLNCGSVLRFQFIQVRPRPGDRFSKSRELAGQFPVQFLGLARDREQRGERRILI